MARLIYAKKIQQAEIPPVINLLNPMDQERLKYLIERYQLNQCSNAEMDELNEWFHAHNPGVENLESWLQEYSNPETLSANLYSNFKEKVIPAPKVIRLQRIYRIAAAAVMLAIIGIAFYPKNTSTESTALVKADTTAAKPADNPIRPGGNKAILTLADGRAITLNDARDGAIATQGNTAINQVKKGEITYNTGNSQLPEAPPIYNTLTTPRGGRYTLTLSDGTVVTLDAASSITYPVVFNQPVRLVQVTGQAYFEVVHNEKQPFRVKAKGQVIEDVGTAFNVNAYADDPFIKITLAEGKVDVHGLSKTVSLVPGEQAQVNDGQAAIAVKRVNVEETVAWKNGWFVFHHESIQNIMKLATRWYDVEVEYQGGPGDKITLGGNISRYKDISELLQNLKITSGINYKIEGRKVILSN